MEYEQRMGDGQRVMMSKEDIIADIEAGANDAAERAKIPSITDDDMDHLLDIFLDPARMVSVKPGDEVVMSTDEGFAVLNGNYSEMGGAGIPMDATSANLAMERVLGADSVTYAWVDYNFKPSKAVITQLRQEIESILLNTICPCSYGAMPNLGSYYKPDGPFDNVGDLMAKGKIMEGLEVYGQVVEAATEDIVWVTNKLVKLGLDNLNIDTAAAAGDGDFLASLKATEILKKTTTNFSVEMGMANEFVLGIDGTMEYGGMRLAGMYPHDQVKVSEKAGVDIFGPVCNTNTRKSTPWNVARAVTFIKECSKVANIPIHPNMGMGVGGIPMVENPTLDAVTKASKAMVEIAGVDGI